MFAGQCTRQSWECTARSPTQSEESEQLQRRSLEIMEKLATEYPKVPDYRSSVGAGSNNIALLLMDRGDWADARQLLEQAIVHQTAALEINPGANEYSIFLSAHLENLTQVQLALGDSTAAARTAEAWRITSIERPSAAHCGPRSTASS